ncbi:replication factor c, putative, partial [Eimeria acervulina]
MLWVDKHAPRRLDDLDCHEHLTPLFRSLAASDAPPHLLLYGPSGAGKKTRALAYLREVFGEDIDKVRVETFVEKETNAEATVCQSNSHIILSCAEFGLRDKQIVQGVIKSLVEAAPQASIASSFFCTSKQKKRFK